MSTIDLNVIAQNLAELLTSVTDQASKNFTLFWDTEPQDVTLKVYNSSNELVEVTVPNLAKARAMGKTGNGSPEGVVVAAPGSIYLDQQYNEVYFKVTGNGDTGWTLALTQASIESLLANYVPRTRTINNKSLRNDITLTSSDIGAIPNTEKLGKSLEVSGINLILKDQDGSNLSSVPIVTTGANKDLSNLTTTGEAHFANPSLSNLNATGNTKVVPTQTGNSGKFLTTNGTTASWASIKAFNIFDMKWSDHLINDIQWLRSDTFSWQSGSVYVTAYNELVSEYNNASSTTETEGSITFKRTPKGYKIADSTQETAILNKYNTDGIAWFYILDTTNTQFKLPRMKYKYWKNQNTLPVKGNGMALGLQQGINGEIPCGLGYLANQGLVPDKGFYGVTLPTNSYGGIGGSSGYAAGITTDSTKSGVVVDTTNAVEETGFYLYFYVGEYTQTAIEQTAGITSEQLNNKLDTSTYNNNPRTNAVYLKTTYINGTSGYNIWSNGYCEQWGQTTMSTSTQSAGFDISYAKTFSNTNYCITLGMSRNDGWSNGGQCQWAGKTTTGFRLWIQDSYGCTWRACGYLAEGEY